MINVLNTLVQVTLIIYYTYLTTKTDYSIPTTYLSGVKLCICSSLGKTKGLVFQTSMGKNLIHCFQFFNERLVKPHYFQVFEATMKP